MGTTIDDLGGGGGNQEKKNSEALLQKKKFRRASSRKNIWRGYREEKINSFSNFLPPPRPLMVDPYIGILCAKIISLYEIILADCPSFGISHSGSVVQPLHFPHLAQEFSEYYPPGLFFPHSG